MGFNKRLYGSGGNGAGRNEIFEIRNQTFFDRRPIIAALEYKYRHVLARLGGFIRTTMQRSMRHRSKTSKVGQPPTSWVRDKGGEGALRALVEFGYDAAHHRMICGPQKIDSPTIPLGGKSVPQLLNEGGDAYIRSFGGRKVLASFGPRPFDRPAADKGVTKLAGLLADVPLVEVVGR